MRLLLLALGICVAIVGFGNRAEAQDYPWCAQYSDAPVRRIAGLQVFSNAWPMSAVLAGSAYKIVHISPHVVRGGAILIDKASVRFFTVRCGGKRRSICSSQESSRRQPA